MRIDSSKSAQVRHVAELQKKARKRREEGLFIVEGIRMVQEVPRDRVEAVYASDSFLAQGGEEKLRDLSYTQVSDQAFKAMTDTQTPQGVLAVVRAVSYTEEDLLRAEKPLLMILENLQDPGNLGTILRAGEGAGVTGVIVTRETVDVFNPKVIRSTMGSIYRMPFVVTEDLSETLKKCKAAGIRTCAAHLKGTNNYEQGDYTGATAFLIGNEAAGLTDATAEACDLLVKIPMAGQVESLNAAIAATILMYETARQRRNQ